MSDIQISQDWTVEAGTFVNSKGQTLNKKYEVVSAVPGVPNSVTPVPKIVVHLREIHYTNDGIEVENISAGYEFKQGEERRYHDGTLMPKLDAQGNKVQEVDEEGNPVFEEDGTTPVYVLGRTDSYERTIYALENGLFTKQILIDGIKEYYKIA